VDLIILIINQILLGLFEVPYAFHDCIWVVYIIWYIFVLMLSQILLWNVFWNIK